MHSTCSPPVAHSNLKAANILLDEELMPHLSDCGLAILRPLTSNSVKVKVQTIKLLRYPKGNLATFLLKSYNQLVPINGCLGGGRLGTNLATFILIFINQKHRQRPHTVEQLCLFEVYQRVTNIIHCH